MSWIADLFQCATHFKNNTKHGQNLRNYIYIANVDIIMYEYSVMFYTTLSIRKPEIELSEIVAFIQHLLWVIYSNC